jgi:hypothetical protein
MVTFAATAMPTLNTPAPATFPALFIMMFGPHTALDKLRCKRATTQVRRCCVDVPRITRAVRALSGGDQPPVDIAP